MSIRWTVSAWLVTLVVAGCASTTTPAGVLVVEDENRVSDNDLGDLQKKAARLGGNVVLMTPQRKAKGGYFGLEDYATADVYRCEGMGSQQGRGRTS
jgi:hypothetical protein